MEHEQWPPAGVDPTKASIARVYDCGLGGKDNFAADREVVAGGSQIIANASDGVIEHRRFIRRVVRYLSGAGIHQFLDLGCGLPTDENVHDVARSVNPDARIAYVDNDPMVLTHGRALLAGEHTIVVQADVRQPQEIINNPEIRDHLDFDRPIGLLMFAVLHHIGDQENPDAIAGAFRDATCPGSYLALSHFHNPGEKMPDVAAKITAYEELFNETLGTGRWRSYDEILGYFGDFEMMDAGLVPIYEWQSDGSGLTFAPEMYYSLYGGVSRKPDARP